MSAVVHGTYGSVVVVQDDYGQGEIPLTLLHRARVQAVNGDREVATVHGRPWHRDALILADNAVEGLSLPVLPSCHECVDGPAIDVDHHDRPVCLTHTPMEG